jgi:hypothetical protein
VFCGTYQTYQLSIPTFPLSARPPHSQSKMRILEVSSASLLCTNFGEGRLAEVQAPTPCVTRASARPPERLRQPTGALTSLASPRPSEAILAPPAPSLSSFNRSLVSRTRCSLPKLQFPLGKGPFFVAALMQHHRDATPRGVGTLPDFRGSFCSGIWLFSFLGSEYAEQWPSALLASAPLSAPRLRAGPPCMGLVFKTSQNLNPHAKIRPLFVIVRPKPAGSGNGSVRAWCYRYRDELRLSGVLRSWTSA